MHSLNLSPRRAALLVASLVSLALLTVPAAVADGAARPVRSGWWWAAQSTPGAEVPVAYGDQPGEILVSRRASAQEKAAAVWVDVDDLTEAPQLMVVALNEMDSPPAGLLSGDLLACPIASTPWEPSQGGAWSARPRGGCIEPYTSIGSREDTGRWTFDLTNMAAAWHDGTFPNYGFEIVPAQHLKTPSFEIGLHAPGPGDIALIGGGARSAQPTSTPPTPAATPTTTPSAPPSATPTAAPATTAPASTPSPEQTAPLPSSMPSATSRSMPATPTAPTAAAAPGSAQPANADDRRDPANVVRIVNAHPSEPSGDASTGTIVLALLALGSVAVGWSRLRGSLAASS